jgi:phytoene dehydrogenase-like protein
MADSWDAVVIGGGHNGLVAAGYLARAGARTLVCESRHKTGGAATTDAPCRRRQRSRSPGSPT